VALASRFAPSFIPLAISWNAMMLGAKKTVTEIALELGYSSLQHFSMAFKKKFGVSPNKMK